MWKGISVLHLYFLVIDFCFLVVINNLKKLTTDVIKWSGNFDDFIVTEENTHYSYLLI